MQEVSLLDKNEDGGRGVEILEERRKYVIVIYERGRGNELQKYSYVCWVVLWDYLNYEIKVK